MVRLPGWLQHSAALEAVFSLYNISRTFSKYNNEILFHSYPCTNSPKLSLYIQKRIQGHKSIEREKNENSLLKIP